MPLPTPRQLKTMDIAYQGQPFVCTAAKSDISLKTMDIAYQAQPFVSNEPFIKKIASVLLSSIKKMSSVSMAVVDKIVRIPN